MKLNSSLETTNLYSNFDFFFFFCRKLQEKVVTIHKKEGSYWSFFKTNPLAPVFLKKKKSALLKCFSMCKRRENLAWMLECDVNEWARLYLFVFNSG